MTEGGAMCDRARGVQASRIPPPLGALVLFAVVSACSDGALVRVPNRLEFDATWAGDTARRELVLEAVGSESVTIEAVSSDSPDIRVENAVPLTIGAGESAKLSVAWTPIRDHGLVGSLRVTSNARGVGTNVAPLAGRTLVVALSGILKPIPLCDDGNPCTDDVFDKTAERCTHVVREGSCDDGNPCTTGERCENGFCRGAALDCGDGDACTMDFCDPTSGCVHTADAGGCDDGDPCTADTCDPAAGCRHESAADGTRCGERTCAIDHVCRAGACREVDVSGESDGTPCFDGDFCTDGDVCEGGSCRAGAPLSAPAEVLATIDTFGGPGEFVATDGYRFVFSSSRATRIAVPDATGRLVVRGRVPVGSDGPPLTVGPGLFIVTYMTRLALIDATVVEQPRQRWETSFTTRTVAPTKVRAVPGGLLVKDLDLLYVDWPSPAERPSEPVTLLKNVADFDVDGNTVVAGDFVFRVTAGASVSKAGRLVNGVRRTGPTHISVRGDMVAQLSGTAVELHRVTTRDVQPMLCGPQTGCVGVKAACDARFPGTETIRAVPCEFDGTCPAGALCTTISPICRDCGGGACDKEAPGVCVMADGPANVLVSTVTLDSPGTDVALGDGWLYVATSAGIRAFELRPDGGLASGAGAGVLLDPLAVDTLSAAPGLLLTSGRIALPLHLASTPAGPSATRLSGMGLGSAVAIADGRTGEVLTAGPATTGRLDVERGTMTSWKVTPTASSYYRPRMLVGTTTSRMVDDNAQTRDLKPGPIPLEVVNPSLDLNTYELEGLGTWNRTDAVGPLFVAATEDNRLLSFDVLAPGGPAPFWNATTSIRDVVAVRATSDGTVLEIGNFFGLEMSEFSAGRLVRTHPLSLSWYSIGRPKRGMAIHDGNGLVLVRNAALELHRVTETDEPLVVSLDRGAGPQNAGLHDLHSMRNGRLWAAELLDGRRWKLSEFSYDDAATELAFMSSVDLDDEGVTQVLDLGGVTVATSPGAIRVIRPTCR